MKNTDLRMLRHLAIFATVVNEQNFAAAARSLAVSPSRVSEAIHALEAYFQARLINRTTRQLSLTNEGKSAFEHARGLPNMLEDIAAMIDRDSMGGKITLTCTHDLAVKFLSSCLADFQQEYSGIQLELLLSDQPIDLISEEIDIAIRVGVPKDSSMIGRSLHSESMRLYASPGFIERHGRPSTIEALQNLNWVCLKQLLNGQAVELFGESGSRVIYITNQHICDSPIMMQKMLCDGMGVGLLLPSTIEQELESKQLVPLLDDWKGPNLDYSLYYPSRRHLPLRTRRLIDHIVAAKWF